jgi:hypothetical protein
MLKNLNGIIIINAGKIAKALTLTIFEKYFNSFSNATRMGDTYGILLTSLFPTR